MIYKILIAIIFSEAITELVVKSEFFYPLRKKLYESNFSTLKFIHEIVDCGYCFSVWAAMFTVGIFYVDNLYLNYFVYIIVLHRLSNLSHFLMDRINGNKK